MFKVKIYIWLDSDEEKISEFAVIAIENIQNEKQTPTPLKIKNASVYSEQRNHPRQAGLLTYSIMR